jgi:predicted transcriptional regulator
MKNVSIHDFESQASRVLSGLKKDKATILTDKEGAPRAYLIDSVTFEGLRRRLELLEGIARGERAIEEGRVLTHTQARKKMARWLKRK